MTAQLSTQTALNSLFAQIHAEIGELGGVEMGRYQPSTVAPPLSTPRNAYRWGERKQKRRVLPKPRARAGEIRLHEFLTAEMARCQVSRQVVYARLMSGKYPGVKVRKVRPRITFVAVSTQSDGAPELLMVNAAQDGEVSLKEFVASEAERLELTESAIYMRLERGAYPGLEFRRVNQRVIFVKVKTLATDGQG